MDKNNQNINKNRKPHLYKVREKLLVSDKKENKYEDPHKGLYPITKICISVTVTVRQVAIQYRINIRCIKPYN